MRLHKIRIGFLGIQFIFFDYFVIAQPFIYNEIRTVAFCDVLFLVFSVYDIEAVLLVGQLVWIFKELNEDREVVIVIDAFFADNYPPFATFVANFLGIELLVFSLAV